MGRIRKGYHYRSGFEARIADQLRGCRVDFEFEPDRIPYLKRVMNGSCLACGTKDVYQKRLYTPDFKLGPYYYVEAKGAFPANERIKMKLVKQQHPELEIRIIFQRNNLLRKDKPERYSDWAIANHFPYQLGGYASEDGWENVSADYHPSGITLLASPDTDAIDCRED
jgi:hypothetical protein